MIKLIVTDMDGTLLDDTRKLPDDIWKTIEELHKKGIMFAVASGRQYQTLADIFDRVSDEMLFMAENGTYLVYHGKPIATNPIEKLLVKELIETGRKIPDAYILLCGTKTAYAESSDERFLSHARKYFNHIEIVDDLMELDEEVLKYTIADFRDPIHNSIHYFDSFRDRCKPAVSSDLWLDVMGLTANKGTALRTMQEKLGISNDETIVFGDYMNDFEMMQYASNSYAMVNAHPEILAVSKFVTRLDNNNNGVIDTLRSLELVNG
ncbi:HAD family hydrolase [Flavobacterium silvaticum]|uniref:HAD family phosphatase n=1 Tax=Flavobacterium silvaticum TaxID=1852020 RepID=A0A972JHG4_9FLAO|nr:HAD family hydrolase [Flavobacterium silvaticum]NMH29216.1 HAD family phosphatase [Flavobacterium silvaticum]